DAYLGRNAPRECETVSTVIASAAKQSMSRHKERMDCFAALAMTRIVRSSDERSEMPAGLQERNSEILPRQPAMRHRRPGRHFLRRRLAARQRHHRDRNHAV